jgi:hypothetical protein
MSRYLVAEEETEVGKRGTEKRRREGGKLRRR